MLLFMIGFASSASFFEHVMSHDHLITSYCDHLIKNRSPRIYLNSYLNKCHFCFCDFLVRDESEFIKFSVKFYKNSEAEIKFIIILNFKAFASPNFILPIFDRDQMAPNVFTHLIGISPRFRIRIFEFVTRKGKCDESGDATGFRRIRRRRRLNRFRLFTNCWMFLVATFVVPITILISFARKNFVKN